MVGAQVGPACAGEGWKGWGGGAQEAEARLGWQKMVYSNPPAPAPGHHGALCCLLYCTHSTDEKTEVQRE